MLTNLRVIWVLTNTGEEVYYQTNEEPPLVGDYATLKDGRQVRVWKRKWLHDLDGGFQRNLQVHCRLYTPKIRNKRK